jgi:hypothetical protein
MNMKRGLVFSLCALALAAVSSSAQAQAPPAQNVQLSLNLRYTDPADPSEGGTWQLVAKTDGTLGIAGISAYISNIAESGTYGNGGSINAATLGAILNGGNPYFDTFGSAINIVYGQDTANGPIVPDVGRGQQAGVTAPGEVLDALKNSTWDGASLIANGTFAGPNRPAFIPSGTNVTDANTLSSAGTTVPKNTSVNANTTFVVRGDASRVSGVEGVGLGLFQGDANRDGVVNSSDLSLLLTNFNGSPRTWDQGDFNDSASVNSSDLSLLLTNFNMSGIPVSATAIPEPSSLVLAGGSLLLSLVVRRRRS